MVLMRKWVWPVGEGRNGHNSSLHSHSYSAVVSFILDLVTSVYPYVVHLFSKLINNNYWQAPLVLPSPPPLCPFALLPKC